MPKAPLIALTCVLACLSSQARSQATAPRVPPDLEELRKLHEEDEEERSRMPPRPPLPKPAGKYPETIRPSRLLWTCVGTWPGQPIYSAPDLNSKPIGMTSWAAAAGSDKNGFVRVLMFSGATGYVPAGSVHTYSDPAHPGVTCSFSGLNQYGGAVIDYHEPKKR